MIEDKRQIKNNFNPNYANICEFTLGLRPKPHIFDQPQRGFAPLNPKKILLFLKLNREFEGLCPSMNF
jgi:hypothetical protein